MPPVDKLINIILKEIKVEALDVFDKNFESNSFFGTTWEEAKMKGQRGSLMQRTGSLRRSLRGTVKDNSVVISSNVPYAGIHNEGGTITVTAKMKRFFWAKYYELTGGAKFSIKTHKQIKIPKRRVAQAEAYKAMALMRVGSKIKIPQRQFVGEHKQLGESVKIIIQLATEDYLRETFKRFTT